MSRLLLSRCMNTIETMTEAAKQPRTAGAMQAGVHCCLLKTTCESFCFIALILPVYIVGSFRCEVTAILLLEPTMQQPKERSAY